MKEFEVVQMNNAPSGLGDYLVNFRYARGRDNLVYQLPTKAARLAPLLYGIAPVLVADDGPPTTQEWDEKLPLVKLFDEEVKAARNCIQVFSNPIAVVVNCSKHWAGLRETSPAYWQALVNRLKSHYTVIQFGVTSNFTPLENTVKLLDLPVRELAAVYKVIGKYVGVDTGDMHLMLSVGGKCWVARPSETPDYKYSDWEYRHQLIKYYPFQEIHRIYDSIISG